MFTAPEINKRFGKHKGTIEGPNPNETAHADVRSIFKEMANELDNRIPEGRNKSLAMTALEEASMWSHKGIANDQPEDPAPMTDSDGGVKYTNAAYLEEDDG